MTSCELTVTDGNFIFYIFNCLFLDLQQKIKQKISITRTACGPISKNIKISFIAEGVFMCHLSENTNIFHVRGVWDALNKLELAIATKDIILLLFVQA